MNSPKKILIVCPYFPPEGGGLEKYAKATAEYLAKTCEVTVVCATKRIASREQIDGYSLIRLLPNFLISNTPILFSLKETIEKLVKENHFNLIVAHTPVVYFADMAYLVARAHHIPLIIHYHASSLYKGGYTDLIVPAYEYLFERPMLQYAMTIVSDSEYPLRNKFKTHVHKVDVIPPFPEKSPVSKTPIHKYKNILFVGQLDKSHSWKGLRNLIKAFQLFSSENYDYTLRVIGDGNYKEKYISLSKKHNLKVVFTGKLEKEALWDEYLQASFLVVPSISNVEGTPTVLFEAMSFGKPIIGGNVGGIPYVLNNEKCGIVIDARNIDSIFQAMVILSTEPDLYHRLSENALRSINKYVKETQLEKIRSIYESVLHGR